MRSFRLLLLAGVAVSSLAGCQTSRLALAAQPTGIVAAQPSEYVPTDSAGTVVLLHDSQGPQATRAVLPAEEAALFRR
ncbi:hypothetical protein [Hymenobacter actinosclerus]|uniref:Uncharacterized protein n=1 Tax=Hymenobacter actinosclerus TaxID=82805 RepID=A0A1I0I5Z2_9BACT|nr:hypothetical protein [Hymenobacter actinosclerus]SET91276.1 hypothetical protein SAMN04487998_3125 [Hymenobacter actinosclerus]